MSSNRMSGGDRNPNAYTSGERTSSSGEGLTDKVSHAAGDLAQQARETASNVAGQVREQASSMIESQKEKAAEEIHTVAESLRKTGQDLKSQNHTVTHQAMTTAADQLDRLSNYIENSDLSQVVDELGNFARREPAIFFGGALALGLLAGRFLKSSSPEHSYRSMRDRRSSRLGYGAPDYRGGYREYGLAGTSRRGYTAPRSIPYEDDVPTGYTPTSPGIRTGTPGGIHTGQTPSPGAGSLRQDRAADIADTRSGRRTEEL